MTTSTFSGMALATGLFGYWQLVRRARSLGGVNRWHRCKEVVRARGSAVPTRREPSQMLAMLVIVIASFFSPIAHAQTQPLVRMKMELMSIRNRSAGPVPVRVRLEYNQPQILNGSLELLVYDALEFTAGEDLLARIVYSDITLAGQDYEFVLLLPPLKPGMQQNWAVQGWFITDRERIPLSSLSDKIDPPEPHDLITTSPAERGTLMCSCFDDDVFKNPSANRVFLDTALSLDNYNPWYEMSADVARQRSAETSDRGRASLSQQGHVVLHYAAPWRARELPVDPLAFCAFDVVLFTDGGFASLKTEQLAGLKTWLRAGGSVCILPDAPMKPQHLEFLRSVFEQGVGSTADLTLGPDGRLLVIADKPDQALLSFHGLGRAVLLPALDSLQSSLSEEQLGAIVAHLWKVRSSQPVRSGKKWGAMSFVDQMRHFGIEVQKDEGGFWIDNERVLNYRGGTERPGGGWYINPEVYSQLYNFNDRLNPQSEPLLSIVETALLPADIKMVPMWVMSTILVGYVLAIGPVDYFVLGWLKRRKYTWVVFPIVTAIFTMVTIFTASLYMSSQDTGGQLIITDLVDDGVAARQSVIETYYLGSQMDVESQQQSEVMVAANDVFSQMDQAANAGIYGVPGPDPALTVVNYSGRFPQKYDASHLVKQWSPKTVRRMSLEPGPVTPPKINWSDATLVTTDEGRNRLRQQLQNLSFEIGRQLHAGIYHDGQFIPLTGGMTFIAAQQQPHWEGRYDPVMPRAEAVRQLMSSVPTMKVGNNDLFSVVTQVSPQGSGSLEDLAFMDASDSRQWALVVFDEDGEDFRMWRKLYVVE